MFINTKSINAILFSLIGKMSSCPCQEKIQKLWVVRFFTCYPRSEKYLRYLMAKQTRVDGSAQINNRVDASTQANTSMDASTQTCCLDYTQRCCVCFNSIQKIYAMGCGHTSVCVECLRNKNKNKNNKLTECPICREPLNPKKNRQIYVSFDDFSVY